jgi:hypothetical protein
MNGGGLYSTDILDVTGGCISYNKATSDGGGIGVWGGTTTLKNVTVRNNQAANASCAAAYVMNDNSWLYIKGASTQIEGAVTASTSSGERIHLSNKLRWNGSAIEAAVQDIASQAGSILAGGAAISRNVAESMIAEGLLAAEAKSRSPVTTFIRWNIWLTKQVIVSLQSALWSAKEIAPQLLSQMEHWSSQLPRMPAQQQQLPTPLPRLPSWEQMPSQLFSHPLHFQQALDIIDI